MKLCKPLELWPVKSMTHRFSHAAISAIIWMMYRTMMCGIKNKILIKNKGRLNKASNRDWCCGKVMLNAIG